MFYSQLILAKKGPLGTIWIAAHLERKLRKNQVTETNISVSVDSILFPEAPIALRLSGHLLLGVVRIYSRKVNYLFHDCSEALTKIKQAFQAGAVDLPPEHTTAPFHAITLPENFDLDEFEPLPERESVLLASGAVDQHVTTREQITLQDPMEENIYFGSQFGLDERLPQADLPRMGLDFEEEESRKDAQERERSPRLTLEEEVVPAVEEYRIDFDRLDEMEAMDIEQLQPMTPAPPPMAGIDVEMEERPEEQPEEFEQLAPVVEEPERVVPAEEEPEPEQMVLADVPRTAEEIEEEVSRPPELEAQPETVAQEADEEVVEVPDELVPALEAAAEQAPSVVSPAHLPLGMEDVPEVETLRSAVDVPADQAPDLFGFERETARAGEELPVRDTDEPMMEREQPLEFTEAVEELREVSVGAGPPLTSPRSRPSLDLPAEDDVLASLLGGRSTPSLRVAPTPSEDAPTRRARRAPKPPPRKRKPVLDVATVLHGDVMRQQLADTTDIRRVRKKAPCTRSELWTVQRQSAGIQVLSEPSIPGLSNVLRELYNRVLVPGATTLPAAEPRREATPEAAREEVPATPRAEGPIVEPETGEPQAEEERPAVPEQAVEFVEEPGLELAIAEPAVESAAEPVMETVFELAVEAVAEPVAEAVAEPDAEAVAEPVAEAIAEPAVEAIAEEQPVIEITPSAELSEGVVPTEERVEFPLLETEPEIVSEPPVPSSATASEPILLTEEPEIKDEARVEEPAEEFVPIDEDVEVLAVVGAPVGEEPPDVVQQVAAEAEAVAEAVAAGEAVVLEGVDGKTIIVLDDDGTIIDEGPSSFAVKEEVGEEEIQEEEEELGFLGEPRETVHLRDDDEDDDMDLDDEPDTFELTREGFAGWSTRTRAVAGYLQGVFERIGAGTESQEEAAREPVIGLDHTLRGKSRKEAARLFFETLVLKTKDYVDVDQPQSYGEIYISALPKLVKATF